jgi:hypothetical protein
LAIILKKQKFIVKFDVRKLIECKRAKEKYFCKTEIGGFTIQSDVTIDKGDRKMESGHIIF